MKLQNIILLVSSYVFYGWWDYRFLILIAASTIVDYFVGLQIYKAEEKANKKKWMLVSIIFNIGLLGFFKYYNFFIDSWVESLNLLGYTVQNSWALHIILPVGISFYTFQTLSYSIDINRGTLKPTTNFISFAAFVSFFPQLVAGPIERASNLLPQILNARVFTKRKIASGVKLMIWGFFLKLVVADRAAIYVDAVYNNVENHNGISFMVATVFFAFQIYGDFAGYSLIAIGVAKLFGLELMVNFNRPYFAASVGEFWKRWHISLSTWFKDYVYIPLGGNKSKKGRYLFNLFITFLISGLWHGANWTFVIWGAINGLYLIAETLMFKKKRSGLINIAITFVLINLTWVFFRANSLNEAVHIINDMFTNFGFPYVGGRDDITAPIYTLLAISILVLSEFKREFFNSYVSAPKRIKPVATLFRYSIIIFMIFYLGVFGNSQFIYFQF
ncbi:MAG: MBOAT family O-acyltransferase [Algibacter sp.]|uniref:MBOAT family O-acyltransferase n=1 Tax=Algibacter sp. TaxID=1872428 RepID=UPI003299BB77